MKRVMLLAAGAAVLLFSAAPAVAQTPTTTYPPGACTAESSSQNFGSFQIGNTVTGHFTVVCPGAAVGPSAAGTGRVAFTGANIMRWGMAAAALIAVGILLVMGSRRRRVRA